MARFLIELIRGARTSPSKEGNKKMIMSSVIAVALSLTPTPDTDAAVLIKGDYSAVVGHYAQSTDRRGTTYVDGRDRRGVAYKLVMDKHGYVEAQVGVRVLNFRVQEAG